MKIFRNSAIAAAAIGALIAGLSGCQKQEGPAEHAGKEIDKAIGKVGQNIEKAGEKIQDAAKGSKK
jgi:lysozyme family protein